MREILVIGIGSGHPEQITLQAVAAMNRADVLFVPLKGEEKAALAGHRRALIEAHLRNPRCRVVEFALPERDAANPAYAAGVADWHEAIARLYADLFAEELGGEGVGGFLVWGDPSLYDSTLRILERVRALSAVPFTIEVIPGITSVQALAAAHGIALNRVGEPVTLAPGRRLAGLAGERDVVVMLDGRLAFKELDGEEWDIFWGAYLGTPDEILIKGRLGAVRDRIERARAAARAQHGWIMDIYLLRRLAAPAPDGQGPSGTLNSSG